MVQADVSARPAVPGDEAAIAAHVFARAPTLAEAARQLVVDGVTSPEEALRVARREATDA